MTSRDFCYWLQGFCEVGLSQSTTTDPNITPAQFRIIRNHLDMVFAHEIDPSMGPKPQQDTLNAIHGNADTLIRC